jgi:hypothetical protein
MNIRLIVPLGQDLPRDCYPIDAVSRYGPAIADIAGGFTVTQATGGWKDNQGNLIVEPVTVFDCNIPNRSVLDLLAGSETIAFRQLARRVARELNQDCVYLSIDSCVEYIKQ